MQFFLLLTILTVSSAQYHYGPPTYTAPPLSHGYDGASGLSPAQPVPLTHASEYNKDFFIYAAPAQEDSYDTNGLLQGLKKNLRVIFIRGPEDNGLENTAVRLASAAGEGHTAIYVLNKQPDLSKLAQQIQNAQSENHKSPDVHFVRYRTEADAQNAQHTIHSQFDTLPGQSTSHTDGVASVLNFASPADPVSNSLAASQSGYHYSPTE